MVWNFRVEMLNSFPQVVKYLLVKHCIHYLPRWYKLLVDDSLWVGNDSEHGFHFWFAHSGLLWSRWLSCVPLWTLSFGLQIILETQSFIHGYPRSKTFGSLMTQSNSSWEITKHLSLFSSDRILTIRFAQIFLMFKSLEIIQWHLILPVTFSVINLTLKHQPCPEQSSLEPHCHKFWKLMGILSVVHPPCLTLALMTKPRCYKLPEHYKYFGTWFSEFDTQFYHVPLLLTM